MAHKQKRLSIAVSDDLYEWIVVQAEIMGLPPSTYGTVLLNDARRSKENNDKMLGIMQSLASGGMKDMQEAMKLAIESAADRELQIDPTDGKL